VVALTAILAPLSGIDPAHGPGVMIAREIGAPLASGLLARLPVPAGAQVAKDDGALGAEPAE